MKRCLTLIAVMLAVLIVLNSCNKNLESDSSPHNASETIKRSVYNDWEGNPHKLNVVYFVPNDLDTIADYKRRISGILLQFQRFIAANMQREGYGRKSIGLDMISSSIVNIITIRGQLGKASYDYSVPSANRMIAETEAYFTANPGTKKSDHTLYIEPAHYIQSNGSPGGGATGPPFFGLGKNCFALDYPTMDTIYFGQSGNRGNDATVWIGGLAHELGHGLNLPHEKQQKTSYASYGMALMSAGNSTYQTTPTFLSPGSCAILNNNQIMNTVDRTDWYVDNTAVDLQTLKTQISGNNMIVSGKFSSSNLQVNKIVFWHDTKPFGGNLDYDAVAWAVNPVGVDSFRVTCTLNDFFNTTDTTELRIGFLLPNGQRTTKSFLYTFTNNIPNVISLNSSSLNSGSIYKIVSAVNNTSVMDVNNSGTVNGSSIILWSASNPITNNQKWKATNVGNGYFKLQPQHSTSRALDVPNSNVSNGTQLNIWDDNGGVNQKWKPTLESINFSGQSFFSLIPALNSSKALDVNNGSSTNGTKIQLWDRNGSVAQRWLFVQQ